MSDKCGKGYTEKAGKCKRKKRLFSDSKRPIIITILSIFIIIGAILNIILGIFAFKIIGDFALTVGSIIGSQSFLFLLTSVIIGLIMLFVGIGIFKGKNWARMTYIIVGILGLIFSLFNLFQSKSTSLMIMGLISMILPVFIISYLLFSKKVKSYFGK